MTEFIDVRFNKVIKSSYCQIAGQIGKVGTPTQASDLLLHHHQNPWPFCISSTSTPFARLKRIPTMIYPSLFPALKLHLHLNTSLGSRCTALQRGEEVGDVIPRMPVETSPQPLLVEEVSNQTDRATEHEETVEHTHAEVVLSLLRGESTAVADEVHEADGNATVNVENQVILLGSSDALDGKSIVEKLGAGEVLLDELLDELDTEIGVVPRLDPVANTGNWKLLAADPTK